MQAFSSLTPALYPNTGKHLSAQRFERRPLVLPTRFTNVLNRLYKKFHHENFCINSEMLTFSGGSRLFVTKRVEIHLNPPPPPEKMRL